MNGIKTACSGDVTFKGSVFDNYSAGAAIGDPYNIIASHVSSLGPFDPNGILSHLPDPDKC